MDDQLLTLAEAADLLRLSTGETFARFARRHRIPLIRFGSRIVRVRRADLDRAIRAHAEPLSGRRHSS